MQDPLCKRLWQTMIMAKVFRTRFVTDKTCTKLFIWLKYMIKPESSVGRHRDFLTIPNDARVTSLRFFKGDI